MLVWLWALVPLLLGPLRVASADARSMQWKAVPVFAYYYIWFDTSSWNRAKVDYPLLGRYSSDDERVMRQHIEWAKEAGIGGFIVSWKNTATLSRRLDKLVKIADSEDFKLAIIYEGRTFEGQPLPVDRIATDLTYFADHYANDKAFSAFSRPVVIWSGTWVFTREQVAKVTATERARLFILASEHNRQGYERIADLVDGNAYYWSSVDPATYPGYVEKLDAMGQAVHANNGLWFAPAAVGFDARLIGGTRVVERHDGETLRREMDAALKSSPDAVGLISWNEFSENSHIEPSQTYGRRYVNVLADILSARAPNVASGDSSEPGDTTSNSQGLPVLVGFGLLIVCSFVAIAWRRLKGRAESRPS